MSSSIRCSGVAASRSPGSASSMALRRYVPPCEPTRSSMPGAWWCRLDRGDATLVVDDRAHRGFVDHHRIAAYASSPGRARDPRGGATCRCRRATPCRGSTCAEPNRVVARACRSASRRAVPAAGGAIRGKRKPRRGRSPGHPTEPSAFGFRTSAVPSRAWTISSRRTSRRAHASPRCSSTPHLMRWRARCPACPAWTVHDLAAHLAGVPATLAAGNLPER